MFCTDFAHQATLPGPRISPCSRRWSAQPQVLAGRDQLGNEDRVSKRVVAAGDERSGLLALLTDCARRARASGWAGR